MTWRGDGGGCSFTQLLSDKVTEGARQIRLITGDHGSSSGVENTCTLTVLPAFTGDVVTAPGKGVMETLHS